MLLRATALCLTLVCAAPALAQTTSAQTGPAKPVVASVADLPPRSYHLPKPPSELAADRAASLALARELDRDAAALLDGYDIRDSATRQDLLAMRMNAALLAGDDRAGARFSDQLAALNEKPALKATQGLTAKALESLGAGVEPSLAVRTRLDSQPAAVVRPRALQLRRNWLLYSPAFIVGDLRTYNDPAWRKDPGLGRDNAAFVLAQAVQLQRAGDLRPSMLKALDGWLAAHPASPPAAEIWTARDVRLPATGLTPVTLAIWDVGVDPSVFPGRFAVDPARSPAFDERMRPQPSALRPVPPALQPRLPQLSENFQGSLDLVFGKPSAAADAYAARRLALTADQVQDFVVADDFFFNYVHGTHVAGVALRGNPAARLFSVRIAYPIDPVPPLQDEAFAQRFAAMAASSVAAMRAQQVRVANMSWGFGVKDIAGNLEANGVEPDPAKRMARAEALFETMFQGMKAAMAGAPEILFVCAAGNSDTDVNFTRDLPGSIDLPNVLIVGAADHAGAPASFTSTGKSVALYASGYEVESPIVGGALVKWSGSSLSAPQVVNAAGRLLAIKPSLTTAQLRDALVGAAAPLPGATPPLPLLDGRKAQQRLGLDPQT